MLTGVDPWVGVFGMPGIDAFEDVVGDEVVPFFDGALRTAGSPSGTRAA